MSLARRHRERLEAAQRGEKPPLKPQREVLLAKAKPAEGEPAPRPLRDWSPPKHSLAAKHRQRVEGELSASAPPAAAANDNDPAERPADRTFTPYDHQLLQLAEDKKRLKAIQSVEKKIELKRELVPNYGPWCVGVLAAAASTGQAQQDEVLTTIMIWRLDIGDFQGALTLAEHVLKFGLALPERYQRGVGPLLVEEIAEAALKAVAAGESFPIPVLDDVEILTAGIDMHDQIKGKYLKARGLVLLKAAEAADGADHEVAGFQRAAQHDALACLKRARELSPKVGVTKEIERLERAIAKLPPPPPPARDPG